ncbi:hypothetical protein LC593_30370 [Nostoc sp. CHAB 5844]|nr:hypothetical protein [Nostoc sp. CHAB 5844]
MEQVAPEGNPPAALIHRNALVPLLKSHASRAAVGKPAQRAGSPCGLNKQTFVIMSLGCCV